MDPKLDRIRRLRRRIAWERIRRKLARNTLEGFLRFVWWKPWDLLIGNHTRALCKRIDKAIADYLDGKSTCLMIGVPFRHGKSDIGSRALPGYFVARCRTVGRDPDLIMSGYGDTLVQGFSKDAQAIVASRPFQILFPDVRPSPDERAIHEWRVDGATGRISVVALGGGLTGKGGDLIVLDDYCKNREEARSEVYREKTWSRFQDLMSRRAPVSIVLVIATPWHIDDVRGRIKKAMIDDPSFPRFEELNFPAKVKDASGKWSGRYLFEERFPREWYQGQYAAQGSFAPALLDCDPTTEGGNLFKVGEIVFHDSLDDFPNVQKSDGEHVFRGYKRGWDLASSEKQRATHDPDFTVGVKGFVKTATRRVRNVELISHEVWIADVVSVRAEAPKRDALILETAVADGPGTSQHVEDFGAYKDAFVMLRKLLQGVVVVEASHLPGDKVAKASPLEGPIAGRRFHVLRAPWTDFFIQQMTQFPDGAHDDAVDAAVVMFDAFVKDRPGIASPEYMRMLQGGR